MKHRLIFKAIVGSQAYGTAIPTSDIDYKGVYIQKIDELITFGYEQQVEPNKDEIYYEVQRFLQLLQSANPTVLELLYTPNDCIEYKMPVFGLITQNRGKFLTKKCLQSFGGYAVAQIRKAKGLNKKMNWDKNKVERKGILDFCYVLQATGSVPLKDWLAYQKGEFVHQQNYGASKIPNCRDMYYIYPKVKPELEYRGLVNEDETSNDLRLCSIPVSETMRGIPMSYNKDGYTEHCKDFKEYQIWLENRNEQRYVDNKNHDQKIDGKNLLHCRRLIDMATEIAATGTISVRRPNADYLLSIRRGEVPLDEIIAKADQDIDSLNELYAKSNLPDQVDKDFVNDLLLQIRHFKW